MNVVQASAHELLVGSWSSSQIRDAVDFDSRARQRIDHPPARRASHRASLRAPPHAVASGDDRDPASGLAANAGPERERPMGGSIVSAMACRLPNADRTCFCVQGVAPVHLALAAPLVERGQRGRRGPGRLVPPVSDCSSRSRVASTLRGRPAQGALACAASAPIVRGGHGGCVAGPLRGIPPVRSESAPAAPLAGVVREGGEQAGGERG
jgi:hypothetical protein